MAQEQQNGFAYRVNANKTVDSICLNCYQTVGTRDTREELQADEARHAHACEWPARK